MDRNAIIAKLQAHRDELRRLGVSSLALFGSYARDAAGSRSDIDLLGDLDQEKQLSLLDVIGIEIRLSDLLGRKVDFIDSGSLDPHIRPEVEASLIRAY